jgi:hypothetical protein
MQFGNDITGYLSDKSTKYHLKDMIHSLWCNSNTQLASNTLYNNIWQNVFTHW